MFQCTCCGYTAKTKQTLQRHHARKIKCIEKTFIPLVDTENENQNENEAPDPEIAVPVREGVCKCKWCARTFNFKSNMYKHQQVCKEAPASPASPAPEIQSKQDPTMEAFYDIIKKYNISKEAADELIKALPISTTTEINTTNNTATINNNTVNIILSFGNEDISYITDAILTNLVANSKTCVQKLIRLIHFNPEHPENQNIRRGITSRKSLNAFDGHKWNLVHKNEVLNKMIRTAWSMIMSFSNTNQHREEISEYYKQMFEMFKAMSDEKVQFFKIREEMYVEACNLKPNIPIAKIQPYRETV